jgi:molybdopterin molybdotransferase
VFARPILRRLGGLPDIEIRELALTAAVRSPAGRRQFLRGRITAEGVEPASGTGSHLVAGMAWADVLIDVPAEVTELPAGATVSVRAL